MLGWALTFLVLALIAGLLGFSGIAGVSANIAWIFFVVFLVLTVVAAVARALRARLPGPSPELGLRRREFGSRAHPLGPALSERTVFYKGRGRTRKLRLRTAYPVEARLGTHRASSSGQAGRSWRGIVGVSPTSSHASQ
jgi:uncharacterized membrane protein YtjA (UPF0391 family)